MSPPNHPPIPFYLCFWNVCSCLISEWMLIQGTNRSDIPEPEPCVRWKDSWRRPWDSGKGEMEVLLSWIEPGDFSDFPLFLIACFSSSWRTAPFQWCIFLMPGLLSQECWAAGTALPAPPQPCFIHPLILPRPPGPAHAGLQLFAILPPHKRNLWMAHLVCKRAAMQSRARTIPVPGLCGAIPLLI